MRILVAASDATTHDLIPLWVQGGLVLAGTFVTAWFSYLGVKRTGKPNGKGDVVTMNEKQLALIEELHADQKAHRQETKFLTDLLLQHMSNPDAHGGNHRVQAGR